MAAGFPREHRLTRKAEFDRVFRTGRRLDGSLFVLLAAPNGRPQDRLGVTVGRGVGRAVARNRARRLVREGFRRLPASARPCHDLVVVAKRALVGCRQAEVDRELQQRVERLQRVATGKGGPRPPAAH
jgi:ribonuclease P protein component